MWGPTKDVGPIGLAVLTFIGNKQTDKQSLYLYIYIYICNIKTFLFKCMLNLIVTSFSLYSHIWRVCVQQSSESGAKCPVCLHECEESEWLQLDQSVGVKPPLRLDSLSGFIPAP